MITDAELKVLRAIGQGRFDDALVGAAALRGQGYPDARFHWLNGTALTYRADEQSETAEANYSDGMESLRMSWFSPDANAESRAMALTEATRAAYRRNDKQVLRRLRLRAEQLWMAHRNDDEVQKWRGPTLLNFGNHHLRNAEYQEALAEFDAAGDVLQGRYDQLCALARVRMQQVWCLCQLGRPSDAMIALQEARSIDYQMGGANRADLILAKSRILLATGYFSRSVALAQHAGRMAAMKSKPDGQLITEAKLQELAGAVALSVEDPWAIAEEVRQLASKYRLSYIFRLVKLLLHGEREEVRKWRAL